MPVEGEQRPSDKEPSELGNDAAADANKGSTFATVVDLIRAVIWPFSIALFLLVFRGTARNIADEIPSLLAHTTKFSAGGLALEIKEQAEQKGGASLSAVVQSLDGDAVAQLLKLGCTNVLVVGMLGDTYMFPDGTERATLLSLESHGLIAFHPVGDNTATSFEELEKQAHSFPTVAGFGGRYLFTINRVDQKAMKLLNTEYTLTPLGRNAYNSILTAIVSQLPRTTGAATSYACEPSRVR